ncbi:MAG: helix-turn-helix transcriptional regulator [Bryobacteraceae bacterium]
MNSATVDNAATVPMMVQTQQNVYLIQRFYHAMRILCSGNSGKDIAFVTDNSEKSGVDAQRDTLYPMHRYPRYKMNFKGTLSTLILKSLAQESSHGYRIAQQIKERSQGVLDFREGTLYPALHKLENEGLIESAEAIENGRMRRSYRITKSGREVLARDSAEWRVLSRAVTTMLGEV